MKRVFAFTICLIFMMANNAFSGDVREDARNPGQVRHHQVNQTMQQARLLLTIIPGIGLRLPAKHLA